MTEKSQVFVIKTSPSTVLEDYSKLMKMAEYEKYYLKNQKIILITMTTMIIVIIVDTILNGAIIVKWTVANAIHVNVVNFLIYFRFRNLFSA